jgi:hypothetical protein
MIPRPFILSKAPKVLAMGTFAPGYRDFLLESDSREIAANFGFPPGQCMDETFLVSPTLPPRVIHHVEPSLVEG